MKITQLYLITNICNGKKYVGFTGIGLHKRWAKHLKDSETPLYPLHRAIAKYGADKFTMISIYESLDAEHISSLEEHFIQLFDTRKNGYNVALGGRGGNLGPIANQKRSQTMLNRTSEQKEYYKQLYRPGIQKGQNRPEVRQAKSSRMIENKLALGIRHSEEMKLKWSRDRIGKPKSEETKQKMSLSAIKRNTGQRFNVRATCLCCRRTFDLGNYTQHIKRGMKQ